MRVQSHDVVYDRVLVQSQCHMFVDTHITAMEIPIDHLLFIGAKLADNKVCSSVRKHSQSLVIDLPVTPASSPLLPSDTSLPTTGALVVELACTAGVLERALGSGDVTISSLVLTL